MRIQHNIMAMNAYRNYNNNTKKLSGNLEKLSSGYKINRAGDDAAGLAISEKMRAQITGLDAAQKNVKDGISLVKTAEGAMQEIQDMLNRMDYLATQSANGTYDKEVDRANLQKEVDALKEEINRIAASANFNGIKLLDGTQAGTAAQSASTEVIKGESFAGVDRMLKAGYQGTQAFTVNGSQTVYDNFSPAATKAEFKVDLKNLNFSFTAGAGIGTAGATIAASSLGNITLTIGDKEITIKASQLASSAKIQVSASGVATVGIKASAVAQAALKSLGSGSAAKAKVNINGVNWKVTADGNTGLKFTQVNNPTSASQCTANFSVQVSYGTNGTNTIGSKGKVVMTGDIGDGTTNQKLGVVEGGAVGAGTVFEIKESDIRDGTKIAIGTQTLILKVGKDGQASAATGETLVDLTDLDAANIDLNKALTKIGAAINSANFKATKPNGSTTTVAFKVGVSNDANGPKGIAVWRDTAPTAASQAYFTTQESLGVNFSIQTKDTTIKHEAVAAKGGLTLQIGDTADPFNQMKVAIGSMKTDAMGIADVNIGTQEGAQAAIATIKNAINYVSGVRGDLGAIQNRLEHTGNNLSVMAENIQDAESTIRDTDVADEMMKYVKNNILVQSAQAMLAQANQVPQGVLQLLG